MNSLLRGVQEARRVVEDKKEHTVRLDIRHDQMDEVSKQDTI